MGMGKSRGFRSSAYILLVLFCFSFTTLLAERPRGFPGRYRDRQPCKASDRWWLDAEYLYWRFKDSPEPVPLIVEGPVPASKVVLGGENINTNWRSGGKLALGYWFDPGKQLGGEVSYLLIPNGSTKKTVSSDGSPDSAFLSVPYFDVNSGREQFAGVARPGIFAGTAKLVISNCMQSSEANVITVQPQDCSTNMILLAGLRYWGFEESLSFKTDSPFVPPFPADIYRTKDHFRAENHFYGGQTGTKVEYVCNGFFADMQVKAAFGTMHQKSVIRGQLLTNDFNDFGAAQKFKGGYFTMPSNIKTRKTECFAIISEASVNIGYRVTDRFKLQVGYAVMYVNNVLRPGKEISREINPTQSAALTDTPDPVLVGEALPKSKMKSANFCAQGLNAGIEFAF